jgi:hypothetical protein
MRKLLCLAVVLAAIPAVWAQKVIAARAGLIHKIEGSGVTLDGKEVKQKFGEFPIMMDGEVLASTDGRVEVLLSPGVFLRMDERSSLKMISNKLADTRVEVLTGSVIMEMDETEKGTSTMLLFHGAKISPLKHGLYRVDADLNRFRVYDGEAQVLQGDDSTILKTGRQVEFGAVLATSKFDRKAIDSLDQWSAARSEEIARVNLASARSVRGAGKSAYSSYVGSGWYFNPYFGMFSFLPSSGYGYSPYGWALYSPQTIQYYYPTRYYNGGGSGSSSGNTSADRNSVSSYNGGSFSSNPSVGSVAAPSAGGGFGGGGGGAARGGGGAAMGGGGRGR